MAEQAWRVDQIVGNLARLKAGSRAGCERGLATASEHLLGQARRLVPLEEGTLARSGAASVDPSGLQAAVSFATPYAVRQHEDLTYRHDSGRQAKYLEAPMGTERDVILSILAAAVRAAWGT